MGGESRYTTYSRVKLLRGWKETRELSTGQITQRAEELSFPARTDPNDLTPSAVHLRSRAPTNPLSVSSFALSLSLSLSSSTVVGIHIPPLCCVGARTFCCCFRCIVIPWLSRAGGRTGLWTGGVSSSIPPVNYFPFPAFRLIT